MAGILNINKSSAYNTRVIFFKLLLISLRVRDQQQVQGPELPRPEGLHGQGGHRQGRLLHSGILISLTTKVF